MSSDDPTDLGTEVPPRRYLGWLSLLVAVVFLGILGTLAGLWRDGEISAVAALGVGIPTFFLLVLAPVWAGVGVLRRRTFVGRDRLSIAAGNQVRRQLRWADLTEVRPGGDGSAGEATPELWNKAVTLCGLTTTSRPVEVKLSGQYLETIDPVLRALEPEVTRRPELIQSDTARALFVEYVAAPPE